MRDRAPPKQSQSDSLKDHLPLLLRPQPGFLPLDLILRFLLRLQPGFLLRVKILLVLGGPVILGLLLLGLRCPWPGPGVEIEDLQEVNKS